MSKSEVSPLCASLAEDVEASVGANSTRDYPYLWLDALYLRSARAECGLVQVEIGSRDAVVVVVALIVSILVVTRVGRSETLAREPIHDPSHSLRRRAVEHAGVSRIGLNQRRGVGVLPEKADLLILSRDVHKRVVIRDQEQQWGRPHQVLADASQRRAAYTSSYIANRRQPAVLIGAVRVVDLLVGTRLVEDERQTVGGDPRGAGAK